MRFCRKMRKVELRVRPRTNRIISRSCNRLRTGKVAYFERIPGFPGRAARFSLSSQQVDLGWTLMPSSRAPRERSPHQEPTEIRRTFARNLRQAREAAGLSLRALAKAALSDPAQLANIEANAANITLDTIARLAKSLGLTE